MSKPSVSQKIPAENLFLPAVEQHDGCKIFVRRRKRVRQGRVIGPVQPHEIELIKKQHPEIAERAGL